MDANSKFNQRGMQIWESLSWQGIAPPELPLLEEICRMADRLDLLDDRIRAGDLGFLGEARLQATAFRQLIAEWRRMTLGDNRVANPESQDEGPDDDNFLDELAARREARIADASGS